MEIIPYKTYKEQIELIQSKNIFINSHEKNITIKRLKNHSYYSLINGFKPHFVIDKNPDIMESGTTFNQFYGIKILEMDLSAILLKYLQVIEQGFRTRLSHIIAKEFTTNDNEYLDNTCYVNSSGRKYKTLRNFRVLRDRPHTNSYSYYFKNNKEVSIPPWILLQDANFFDVINLYSCLPDDLRDKVRKEYIFPTDLPKENILFADSMQLIREYRNIYAHSKRNFDEKINYSLDYKFSSYLKTHELFEKSFFDSKQKGKALNVVIPLIFSYLNDSFLFNRLYNELFNLFINDGYIDHKFVGKPIFNGQTIYDVLKFDNNFFNKIQKYNDIVD